MKGYGNSKKSKAKAEVCCKRGKLPPGSPKVN
jgi:hypothetical protein